MMLGRDTVEWRMVKSWLEKQIATKLEELAHPACPIKESDLIRGEIRFARAMIAEVEPERLDAATPAHPRGSPY